MLRALAGYFFGGTQVDAPSAQVECETQEVNDWLVVNMPDQPEIDIDFEEVEGAGEMELEDDEDDVLSSLSFWMTPNEVECVEAPCAEITCKKLSTLPVPHRYRANKKLYPFPCEYECENTFPTHIMQCFEFAPNPNNFNTNDRGWTLATKIQASRISEHKNNFEIQERNMEKQWMLEQILGCTTVPKTALCEYYLGMSIRRAAANCIAANSQSENLVQRGKDFLQLLKERNGKSRANKTPLGVTCHPVYSDTYVNHRHPALSPKTDLLQRIKELEPEQQASERALKKHITRGQLNRQNKNYIYDTSTKKNRRKNLQRNPSGANNNRKC